MNATLRLFKALPVPNLERNAGHTVPRSLLEVTVPKGFIFSPEVVAHYPRPELLKMAEDIGLLGKQLNSSFHKSWKKVRDADIAQLVLEQILHYITTYGFQALGIYDKDSVYIPNEQLDVPDVKIDDMNLVVIRGYTKETLKAKVLKMLSSGVALKEDTSNDIVEVCIFVGVTHKDLKEVKNKETRIKLYEYLNILPEDPLEFLRLLLYRATGDTLLIKSKEVVAKIVEADTLPALMLFANYKERYGLRNLAKIFNRFKPLFLAFKSSDHSQMNSIINRISKLSKIHHQTMKWDYLNEITGLIKNGHYVSRAELSCALDSANTFRKIRLAYALNYRTKDVSSILYRIRNGKSWATAVHHDERTRNMSKEILNLVYKSIIEDISKHVGDKKIYLPENVEYALPATEKQFTGNLPSGSYVTVEPGMVFGIHWFNHKSKSVDLDLSFISADGKKYGWDGEYRSSIRDILYSGDKTDAPRPDGASELFYLQKGSLAAGAGVLMVNYYNYTPEEVPFEIIVGRPSSKSFNENYMIDPNDIVCSVESKMDRKQKILGIVEPVEGGFRFYFSETYLGKSITSKMTTGLNHAKQYLVDYYTDALSLSMSLRLSGVKIVGNEEDCDISLSLEKIEKDTILNLLS